MRSATLYSSVQVKLEVGKPGTVDKQTLCAISVPHSPTWQVHQQCPVVPRLLDTRLLIAREGFLLPSNCAMSSTQGSDGAIVVRLIIGNVTGHTMRFVSTAKVLANCKLKYHRISEWAMHLAQKWTGFQRLLSNVHLQTALRMHWGLQYVVQCRGTVHTFNLQAGGR